MNEGTPVVYIVDDEPAVRRLLTRLIKSAGLEARSFPSATKFLKDDRPDVPSCLVLDVSMPKMSGLDLQQALTANNITIPIIFVTGYGSVPTAVEAMKAGAVDFLQKPIEKDKLIDTVQRAISRDREQRDEQAEIKIIQERIDTLTPREREVFALVVTGLLNKEISAELGAAEKTVKVHRGRVMAKMQAQSLADLVRMAERVGIQQSDDQAGTESRDEPGTASSEPRGDPENDLGELESKS